MIIRYLTYLFFVRLLMGTIGNIFIFPVAFMLKKWARKKDSFIQTFLWWWLHDGCDYGDIYFLEKKGNKKTFKVAWAWAFRNPTHNFYYSHTIDGKGENYRGWATIQKGKQDSGKMWRTVKTKDENGNYKGKHGGIIDYGRSILGKQRITFTINGKKYFRYSGARPRRIWKNIFWFIEYKFGFENVNWAIQFKPLKFKRYNGGKINYKKIEL